MMGLLVGVISGVAWPDGEGSVGWTGLGRGRMGTAGERMGLVPRPGGFRRPARCYRRVRGGPRLRGRVVGVEDGIVADGRDVLERRDDRP